MKKLTRRDFISHSTLSAAGILLPLGCASSSLLRRPAGSGESVAVIGAGMAGISAARVLQDSGQCRVTVFEARNRIGGRVNTRETPAGKLEYGASWLHHPKVNALVPLCKKYGIAHLNTDRPEQDVAYLGNGQIIPKKEYNRLWDEFSEFCEKIAGIAAKTSAPQSMGDLFDKYAPAKDREVFLHFLRGTNELTYGADLSQLSAEDFDISEDNSGGGNNILPSGYSGLIERHAENLQIEMGMELSAVEHGPSGVTLHFKDGTHAAFDRCVITVPLGVLKNKRIAFDPVLPKNKLEAIDRIGFGHFTKLFITFPKAFWPEKASLIEQISPDPERVTYFFNLAPFTGSPTLIGMLGGSQGLRWQQGGKDKAVARALEQLSTIFGKIPDPIFYDITTWGLDGLSGGSYSFVAKGGTGADMTTLAAPINNRLFFAGEACNKDNYASVDGAHGSGRATAGKILKLLA